MNEFLDTLKTKSVADLYETYCQPWNSIVNSSRCDYSHVTSLVLYPVKGCMAFPVQKWPIHEAGLYLDRHWCIKSLKSGKLLNISKKMDTIIIHPYIDLKNKILILATPAMEQNLILKISENEFCMTEGRKIHSIVIEGVNIGDTLEDCGDEAAAWINEALSMDDCRLVRQIQLRENKLSLACESHIQLMNIASLENLKKGIALEQGFMNTSLTELCIRFRPNIVVGGLKKYEESRINILSIKGVMIQGVDLVERCKAVNLDLERFDYELYPLKYLVNNGGGIAKFGLHTLVLDCNDNGIIEVGDQVNVLSYKE